MEDLANRIRLDRIQHEDTRPGEERGVDLERRIQRRGSDQDDRAVFHVRQKCILLRPIEPVDLVDEEDGPSSGAAFRSGPGDDLPDLLDAGGNGAEGGEAAFRDLCNDAGERGLPGSGRTPEDDGRKVIGLDHPPERGIRSDQVFLSPDLVQRPGAYAVRQRSFRPGRVEEVFRGHGASSVDGGGADPDPRCRTPHRASLFSSSFSLTR